MTSTPARVPRYPVYSANQMAKLQVPGQPEPIQGGGDDIGDRHQQRRDVSDKLSSESYSAPSTTYMPKIGVAECRIGIRWRDRFCQGALSAHRSSDSK
jgi:hypothetical protein